MARLDANGAIVAATYLGGSDGEMGREGGIAVGPLGSVWATGRTLSTDFPSVNAFDPSANGNTEGFVAQRGAMRASSRYWTRPRAAPRSRVEEMGGEVLVPDMAQRGVAYR